MKNPIQNLYLETFNKKAQGNEYYFVSVKPFADNITYAAFFSIFNNNFSLDKNGKERYEERKICLVDPLRIKYQFQLTGQGVSVIDTKTELIAALKIGGHLLVEQDLMHSNWSEILVPKIVVNSHDKGCLDYNLIAKPQLARFARGELRMEILIRDDFRCRICGKSIDDERYLNIEVHHIKPWEEGAFTEPTNLITLCNSCHGGICSVDRKKLYKKIGINFPLQNHMIYETRTPIMHVIYNSVTFKIDKIQS